MCLDMYKETGVGRSKAEARKRAEEALKERLWKEVWKHEVEIDVEEVSSVEVGGIYEVTIKVKQCK